MINFILKLFGFKLIRVSNEYDILGKAYRFPLRSDGLCILDSDNKFLPFYFENEEEAQVIVNLFNMHSK